jgi:phosphatidylglycerol:prolipoprotein diacylglycerol transferase
MRPVLFELRGMKIHAYPAFLFLGLTSGVIAGTEAGRHFGLNPVRLYAGLIILIIPALIGGRLLFVLTHMSLYRDGRARMFSPRAGGGALYGGLILALLCSVVVIPLLRLPLGAFWDAATITLLVGMAFTKVGCLLEGCCAGRRSESPVAMNLPNAQGVWCPRIPAQLMECGLAVVLLAIALSWSPPFGGALFLAALAAYSAARIPLGAVRETVDRAGKIRIDYAISITLFVGSVIAIIIIR